MASPTLELPIYFIGFLMTLEAARAVRSSRTRVIWRRLGLRHLRAALIAIPLVVVAYLAIAALLPWTQWGWWSALGGLGNIAAGQTATSPETEPSLVLRVAPFFFLAAMLCYLPAAARLEERWFRLGGEHRSTAQRTGRALAFGLVHLVMGIPIAAALAITGAGWIFQREYLVAFRRRGSRHDAMVASTSAHLAYNMILLSLAAAALGLSLLR